MARGPEVARTLVVVTLHGLAAAKQLVEEAGFGDVEPGAGHKQRGEHDQRACPRSPAKMARRLWRLRNNRTM